MRKIGLSFLFLVVCVYSQANLWPLCVPGLQLEAVLYPAVKKPRVEGFLDFHPGHRAYYSESGNEKGYPVIVLHGGPGAGTNPTMPRYFDPKFYRIILLDQLGAGKSTAEDPMRGNTTENLVALVATLFKTLGLKQAVLFGGSWGTTLGLAVTQAHSDKISHVILRGVFGGTRDEVKWMVDRKGPGSLFPQAWDQMVSILTPRERRKPFAIIKAYHDRLNSADPSTVEEAFREWTRYQNTLSVLQGTPEPDPFTPAALQATRIEVHYLRNDCFLSDQQILLGMPIMAHIPGIILQGQYDMLCPARAAQQIHERWSASELRMVLAGHSAGEVNIAQALVEATNEIRDRILESRK